MYHSCVYFSLQSSGIASWLKFSADIILKYFFPEDRVWYVKQIASKEDNLLEVLHPISEINKS